VNDCLHEVCPLEISDAESHGESTAATSFRCLVAIGRPH